MLWTLARTSREMCSDAISILGEPDELGSKLDDAAELMEVRAENSFGHVLAQLNDR